MKTYGDEVTSTLREAPGAHREALARSRARGETPAETAVWEKQIAELEKVGRGRQSWHATCK